MTASDVALTTQKSLLGLAGWFFVTFFASAVGAMASVQAREFYAQLVQPVWAPPPWLFGPVWTVLYALMAVAAWLVWRSGGFPAHRLALSCFLVQLALNTVWSWLFFVANLGAVAFVDIVLLWGLILATIVLFWRVRIVAAVLLLPYLLWVGFASALNFTLWQLNPEVL